MTILLLGTYSIDTVAHVAQDAYTQMFTAELFVTEKDCKQP